MPVVEYNEEVRARFVQPPHAGALKPDPDVFTASAGSVEQGASYALFARLKDGRVSELKHRVYGCPHSIAAVSLACEQLLGADRERLTQWSWREADQILHVPTEKRGRLLLLEDAVRALAREWPGA